MWHITHTFLRKRKNEEEPVVSVFLHLTLPQAFTFKASFALTYGLTNPVQIIWLANASLEKH